MASARRASVSAGFVRRSTSLRSSPRPATEIPSSLNSTVSRARVGTFQMSKKSLRLTGVEVRCTGTVGAWSPDGRSSRPAGVPGSHWTKFSASRPSGWIAHFASVRKGAKRRSTSSWIRAL
jgi:hypothetical protein